MNYEEKLEQAKDSYPFARWRKSFEFGLEQYTQENCDAMRKIFDDLIADLIAKGETASENEKIESFRIAIEATNELDEETGMVETGEREDLCELTNIISIAAGLNPDDYCDGEGLASEWRDW
jgi:hypothetical protein